MITEYAPNFRKSLIDWSVQAPIDIETRVGITNGNIRHGDMIPSQMLANRFAYRTSIRNFYMCGAGTHPGGEVTAAPGHNSAHAPSCVTWSASPSSGTRRNPPAHRRERAGNIS